MFFNKDPAIEPVSDNILIKHNRGDRETKKCVHRIEGITNVWVHERVARHAMAIVFNNVFIHCLQEIDLEKLVQDVTACKGKALLLEGYPASKEQIEHFNREVYI